MLKLWMTIIFTFGWLLAGSPSAFAADEAAVPGVGDTAVDFELADLDGKTHKLSEFTKDGPVVLVVLRGFPGYQCPICSRQVGGLIGKAEAFREAGAKVVMVYPGPPDQLTAHAKEFIANKTLPDHFRLLVDPAYKFTNAWHLRWDAPRETAYPSTFVVGADNKIRYAKVSMTHGGRPAVDDVLAALK